MPALAKNLCCQTVRLLALRRSTAWIAILCTMMLLWSAAADAQQRTSPLKLSTSDPQIQQAFDWAKAQALVYVSSGHGPLQHFYESALPGRDAFCMRDVSHQAMGAQALGLAAENKAMLTLFAKNIAASRDWASYWEIDREGKPSTADYVSDGDFWYNLPANFDVMSAALRMYMWTGDASYIEDPTFLDFYRHTVTDYIQRWQLGPQDVLSRQRIMNRHLQSGKFVNSRGIPSYTEGRVDFNLGTDLLAVEYRALRGYADLLRMQGSATSAEDFDREAAGVAHILETNGWDAGARQFHGFLQENGEGFGPGDAFVLYFNAATVPEQRAAALKQLQQPAGDPPYGIEEQSYRPEIFFRYNAPEAAYDQILDLSRPNRKRREYPEVSFAIVGSMVTGMMGVGVVPADKTDSSILLGSKVVVQTLPRLSAHTSWAELDNVPVRQNVINIHHVRNRSTSITNVSGPTFTWRATFDGSTPFLRVNGKKIRAIARDTEEGVRVTYTDVPVSAGQTITVSE